MSTKKKTSFWDALTGVADVVLRSIPTTYVIDYAGNIAATGSTSTTIDLTADEVEALKKLPASERYWAATSERRRRSLSRGW